jgi:superfamily II DNA or RNA helicase
MSNPETPDTIAPAAPMDERAQLTLTSHPDDASRAGLFLWGTIDRRLPVRLRAAFLRGQHLPSLKLLLPDARGRMKQTPKAGWWLDAGAAAMALAPLPIADLHSVSPAVGIWSLVSKWVVELVLRQQIVVDLRPRGERDGEFASRWRAAPVRPIDRARQQAIIEAMPGVARAYPVAPSEGARGEFDVLTARGALQAFVDQAVDWLLRSDSQDNFLRNIAGTVPEWCIRLAQSLAGRDPAFHLRGDADSHLPDQMRTWVGRVVFGTSTRRPRTGFRLVEPKHPRGPWLLTYHLFTHDGTQSISATDFWARTPASREIVARMADPEETLLNDLSFYAEQFPAIQRSLRVKDPAAVTLSPEEAWNFITRHSLTFEDVGCIVEIPSALTRLGQSRVRARVRLTMDPRGAETGGTGLLDSVINYRWEASLGDDALTENEFMALVRIKAPLVHHRGKWVAIDPEDVARLQKRFGEGSGQLDPAEALRMALAGEVALEHDGGLKAEVVCDQSVAMALETLRESTGLTREPPPRPSMLQAELRSYQERGFAWLKAVTSLGFGACLADDMGLGKTVQLLTLLADIANRPDSRFLIVCPTSVLGNWRREIARFVPGLEVVLHHGAGRAERANDFELRLKPSKPGAPVVMLTSYALARRDCELLQTVVFDALVLDEAQNIKNPEAAQSQAVRQLRARRRVALTGTPVENRLVELWSILDFLNPNLLGSQSAFKKQFATPIERYGDQAATDLLRRVTAPFVLRRMKTDPNIAPDLPEKITSTRYCPLTREQAALYQNVVDKGLEDLEVIGAGPGRHGRILSMLTAIKQICNHPAQYLRDGVIAPRRSGKLVRFLQLVDEVTENGGSALVFTQFKEMGYILESVLSDHLRQKVPFLHGGLSRQVRDDMVAEFQSGRGSPIFIISLRAGGTGLNLTRANHVFHYDRWWNPAVEDQASDRAFRIGQTRNVTIHQLISQDTLEEKTHVLLEQKRILADRVVGEGETWLSELDDDTLRSLIVLGQDAVLED